jgi:hypothetical protein
MRFYWWLLIIIIVLNVLVMFTSAGEYIRSMISEYEKADPILLMFVLLTVSILVLGFGLLHKVR